MRKILSDFDKISIFKHGIFGFLLFLFIITVSKFVSNILLGSNKFAIDFQDVLTASLGFFLVVIIKAIERFSNSER